MTHPLYLEAKIEEARLNPTHVRLALDPGSDIDESPVSLDSFLFDFLSNEITQTVDGYEPQLAASTTDSYDSVTGRHKEADVTVLFTESSGGTGYSFNRIVLIYKGTDTANKPITTVDTTNNTLTVSSHGLVSGQKVLVTSSAGIGGVPSGIPPTTPTYVGDLTTSTLKLYSDPDLTTLIDINSTGTGTLLLRWANGLPAAVLPVATTTINPSATQAIVIRSFASQGV